MKRVREFALFFALLIILPCLSGCGPGTMTVLGVALNSLANEVDDIVRNAEVEAEVLVIRAGAEVDRAIENARAAWAEELDKTLDRVDASIYSAYQDLQQMTNDLSADLEATVQEVGDRAQILANTMPFANRAPQIRDHTIFFVTGANRYQTGDSATARSGKDRPGDIRLVAAAPPAGWSFDADTATIVVDDKSEAGVFSTRWATRTSQRLEAIITASPFWGTREVATITAHLEWSENRDPQTIEIRFDGSFFHSGDTVDLPSLEVNGTSYPAAEALETRLIFRIPESAFGSPPPLPRPVPVSLSVPYLSGIWRRSEAAKYALTLTQLPTQPGVLRLYSYPEQTTIKRESRSTDAQTVDSNFASADGSAYPEVFTFGLATSDQTAGYVIDPQSVRLVVEESRGKWLWSVTDVLGDHFSVKVTALNCEWYKIECPDGYVRLHFNYDVVRSESGPTKVPIQERVSLEWGRRTELPVSGKWLVRFTDMKGVTHDVRTTNYTEDRFVRITLSPTTVVVQTADPNDLG